MLQSLKHTQLLDSPGSLRLGKLLVLPVPSAQGLGGLSSSSTDWMAFHTETLDVVSFTPESLIGDRPQPLDDSTSAELLSWSDSITLEHPSGPSMNHNLSTQIQTLTINVTQVCNLGCTYCAAGGDGTYGSKVKVPDLELVYAQVRTALDLSANDRTVPRSFTVTFLGGEPLLHPEIIEAIANYAKLQVAGTRVDLRFTLVTNATLVSEQVIDLLKRHRVHVTVSLDGPSELNGLARRTRSGRDSSHATLRGLKMLSEAKSQLGSLTIGAVLGEHHCSPLESYLFLQKLNVDSIKFDFAAHAGDDALSKQYAAGISQIAELAFNMGGEPELRRLEVYDHLFRILDQQTPVRNHCLAGQGHLQVDTEGNWTTCQWFVGSAEENVGKGPSFDGQKLAAWSGSLVEKHGCQNCWAKHLCGGGCQFVNKVKNQNRNQRDSAFCDRTRTILMKGLELYARARHSDPSYQ